MLLATGGLATAKETVTYIHSDISGSPLAATDAAGNVLWKESYFAYGQKTEWQLESEAQTQWFHGKEQDADTTMQYFGARYYDPGIGRFLGIDPVDYQDGNLHSFNRYAYGNNNPTKYLDPDGRIAFLIPFALTATAHAARTVALRFAVTATVNASRVGIVAGEIAAGEALGGAALAGGAAAVGAAAAKGARAGEFSIVNWAGYPAGVPKPQGPLRLLEGAEYDAARMAANAANSTIRREQGLVGKAVDVHEIQPVKFGGSATDPANKVVLPRDVHRQQVTPWWNQLMRDVSGQ
ncbi:hypothetical protein DCO45_12705 [Comamonas sp. JNW]|nr:hypothetical protein DCO45_12705 [Comamonas sp. JNW]